MRRVVLRVQNIILLALLVSQGAVFAKADTITATFTSPVVSGNLSNDPTAGSTTTVSNSGTAVVGTATPGGSSCAAANTLCWGTGADLGIPASEQYSQVTFTGSTSFNSASSASQPVGTLLFTNGTSDLSSLIFGATINFYDNGVFVASDNLIITTTQNQYTGTGLTPAQLATDADYLNICGNDSNICADSIQAFEAGEGGTGLLVDLTGTLVGDPTLILGGVSVDPSQAGSATSGVVGSEPAIGEAPEPSAIVLTSTGLCLLVALCGCGKLRSARSRAA